MATSGAIKGESCALETECKKKSGEHDMHEGKCGRHG